MKKKTGLAAAVLAVLAGGLGWMALDGGGAEPAAQPVTPMVASDAVPVDEPRNDPGIEPAQRVPVEPEAVVVPTDGVLVRVVDGETGEPATGADVRLLTQERLTSPAWARAQRRVRLHDSDGMNVPFEVGQRLPLDGRGQCVVVEPGLSAILFARRDGRMGMLHLRPDELTDRDATLKLWPVHSARVLVIDALGQPMVGVPVGLRTSTSGRPPMVIPLGKTAGPGGLATLSWFRGMFGDQSATRLDACLAMPLAEPVASALETSAPGPQEVTLVCPEVGSVSVRVTLCGQPAPDGTMINLWSPPDLLRGRAAETRAGIATVWPVGLGVSVQAAAGLHERISAVSAVREGPRRPGETVTLEIRSEQRVVTFSGRLLASDRQPIANAFLAVRLAGGGAETQQDVGTTDAEGRFALPFGVEPAQTSGRRLEVRVQTRGAESAEVPLVDLAGQTRVDLGEVLMPAEAPLVEGVVVDDAGQPLWGVTVTLMRESPNGSSDWQSASGLGAATDDAGRFAIFTTSALAAELAGSRLALQARARGLWRHEPVPLSPAASHVRLVMRRTSLLEGHLLVDDGVPLQRLNVAVWPESRGAVVPAAGPMTVSAPDQAVRVTSQWARGIVDDDGGVRFHGLEPDSYTLVVTLPSTREVARVTGLAVRPGQTNTDPRLSPLDLRGAFRVLNVWVHNDRGESLQAVVWARSSSGRGQSGSSDLPLLIPRGDVVERLVVECEGYFSAEVTPVEGSLHEVVLHPGLPVAVRVANAPALDESFSLLIALDPVASQVGRFRDWRRPDHARSPFAPDLQLRVPAAGSYRARVIVQRNDFSASKDVTPQPAPQVEVVEGVTSAVTVELDPAAVQAAIDAM